MSSQTQSYKIRHMQTHADYQACVALQKETWGEDFSEIVPPTIFMVCQKIGGIVAGAFDRHGAMVGFVFGQTGFFENKLMNWSQMLAVSKTCRGSGLGLSLKLFQRNFCLERGIEFVYWTYDPLVARNAHLNLNKLGARIHRHVEDFYPADNGSILHRGMPLDRFIVEWRLKEARVERALAGRLQSAFGRETHTVVNTTVDNDRQPQPVDSKLPDLREVLIEIPQNIERIQATSLAVAARWRRNTRRAFTYYLQNGYSVDAFQSDGERRFYLLRKE